MRREAMDEAMGGAPPAAVARGDAEPAEAGQLAIAPLPALSIPPGVVMAFNTWRTCCVPAPPLANIVSEFAKVADASECKAGDAEAGCISDFFDPAANSLHTVSFAARAAMGGGDRKTLQPLERRMAAVAELQERSKCVAFQVRACI